MCDSYEVLLAERNDNVMEFVLKTHTLVHLRLEVTEGEDSVFDVYKRNVRVEDFELEPVCINILDAVCVFPLRVIISYFDDLSAVCVLQALAHVLNTAYEKKTSVVTGNTLKISVDDKVMLCTNMVDI